MLTVVPGDGSGHEGGKDASPSLIDAIVREGARRMLAGALQAEVDAYIAAHAAEQDENGRRLVVRNGYHQSREVLTSAGAIEVTAPRVNDKRTDPVSGDRQRFSSAVLPPWCRKTPKITEVLPLLYLHGLSSGDFVPALGQFLGSSAGLSPAVITKLTGTWKAEQRIFAQRDLSRVDYVYLWADGIHVEHPPRRAQAVLAGDDRRARRWAQGTHRPGRRLPGVHRVMGGPAARPRTRPRIRRWPRSGAPRTRTTPRRR
jgi:transposase-like protein